MTGPGSRARFVEGSPLRHVTAMWFARSGDLLVVVAVDLVNVIFISMLGRAAPFLRRPWACRGDPGLPRLFRHRGEAA